MNWYNVRNQVKSSIHKKIDLFSYNHASSICVLVVIGRRFFLTQFHNHKIFECVQHRVTAPQQWSQPCWDLTRFNCTFSGSHRFFMSTLYQNVTNSTRYALRIIASEIAQYKPIMMLLSCLIVAILKVTNTVYSEFADGNKTCSKLWTVNSDW